MFNSNNVRSFANGLLGCAVFGAGMASVSVGAHAVVKTVEYAPTAVNAAYNGVVAATPVVVDAVTTGFEAAVSSVKAHPFAFAGGMALGATGVGLYLVGEKPLKQAANGTRRVWNKVFGPATPAAPTQEEQMLASMNQIKTFLASLATKPVEGMTDAERRLRAALDSAKQPSTKAPDNVTAHFAHADSLVQPA